MVNKQIKQKLLLSTLAITTLAFLLFGLVSPEPVQASILLDCGLVCQYSAGCVASETGNSVVCENYCTADGIHYFCNGGVVLSIRMLTFQYFN